MECSAWNGEREELRDVIGVNITLSNIIAISESRDSWRAFQRFAEKILLVKEEAERLRQLESVGMYLLRMDTDEDGESEPGE